MPLINISTFKKTSNKTIAMMNLIKDTVYSLNGSSRNSVSVYPVSIVSTFFRKSLRCVNRTPQNKEIMITMRDIWTSNLEG